MALPIFKKIKHRPRLEIPTGRVSELGRDILRDALQEAIDAVDITDNPAPFPQYKEDPNGFIEDVLGWRPWSAEDSPTGKPGQWEVNEALVRDHRVTWASCNGPGKTRDSSALVLWFMYTRKGRCITIAPSWSQLVFELWDQIKAQHMNAKQELRGSVREHFLKLGPRWWAHGISTDKEERVQGPHADDDEDLFILMEEASGIAPFAFDAVQGYLTKGNCYLLYVGNPNSAEGPFFESHQPNSGFTQFQIGAIDAPRSIITKKWIEDCRRKWGEGSVQWTVRVLGQFPKGGSVWQLFPKQLLEDNADHWPSEHGERHLGLDIARSLTGDYNVLTLAEGDRMKAVEYWQCPNLETTARNAIDLAKAWGFTEDDADFIHVDVTGMGSGVVDVMRNEGWYVDAVDFGGGCKGEYIDIIGREVKLLNRKAELHWAAMTKLRLGMTSIPREFEETWRQLQWLNYAYLENTEKIKVEPKKIMQKRLGISESPDWAESWLLTHARAWVDGRVFYI